MVNGGAGRGRAEGSLACSGLKEDAMEEIDLRAEVDEEDGGCFKVIDLRDNLGMKTDLREMKRERGLGFKRFFELKSDDETANFIFTLSRVLSDDQIDDPKACFNSNIHWCGTLRFNHINAVLPV